MIKNSTQTMRLFPNKATAYICLASLFAVLFISDSALAFDTPVFVREWGGSGNGAENMNVPNGIAADASGNIYVADTGHLRIQKFDSTGTLLTTWGGLGTGPGLFTHPVDVSIAPSGNVYVADPGNGRIQVYSSGGGFLFAFGSSSSVLGTPGGTFYLTGPNSVACAPNGHVYASDPGNHRVQEFDAAGNFITLWGAAGQGDGKFVQAGAIAAGASGTVFVADESNLNDYIQAFDEAGTFLRRWGSSGSGGGQFNFIRGLGTDVYGNVWVADGQNHRVQVFSSLGTYLGQWGSSGTGAGQFGIPEGVAVVGSNVYVLDSGNNRVQQFAMVPVAAIPTSWGKVKSLYH